MAKIKKAQTGTPVDSTKSNLKGVSRSQMLADMNKASKTYTTKQSIIDDSTRRAKSAADRPSWKKNVEKMGNKVLKKGGKVSKKKK